MDLDPTAIAASWIQHRVPSPDGTRGGKVKRGRGQSRNSTPGVARSDAERKQKQRLLEEETKQKLLDVLRGLKPANEKQEEKKRRKRKLISPDEVAAEAILRVREVLSKQLVDKTRDAQIRAAMLKSRTFGTLLLRRQDLFVVESSESMGLFCSWQPMRGYRGQNLEMMVHTSDVEAFVSLVHSCRPGSEGARTSVRLLRLCLEEASDCLLNRHVRVELTVAHVSPDSESLLLTCTLRPQDVTPLATTPEFWREWYARAEGHVNGSWTMVNTEGLMESVSWATASGFESSKGSAQGGVGLGAFLNDGAGQQVVKFSQMVKKLWSDSLGFSENMAQLMEDACPFYIYIARDPNRGPGPRINVASRFRHKGFESPWNQFVSVNCDGASNHLGILSHGALGMRQVGSVRLPEEGLAFEMSISDIFVADRPVSPPNPKPPIQKPKS